MVPIVFDTDVADYLRVTVENYQANEDRLYAGRLVAWNKANAAWLINVQQAAANGRPNPAPPAIPTKEIFGIKDGLLAEYTWQDATLKTPPIPVDTGVPSDPGVFTGTGGAHDQFVDSQLRAILQTVLAIKAKLP